MSIRLKLLLSYAAMLIIPLVTMIVTAALLIIVFRGDFQTIREQYAAQDGFADNHNVERMVKELRRTAASNPEALTDPAYLADVDQELQANKSSLIIRRDDAIVYKSPALQQPELMQRLPAFEHPGRMEKGETARYGNQLLSVASFDFLYADKHPGTIFVVTSVNPIVNFARKFFPSLFAALIVILVLTHTLLTYFVSRSIVKPLQKLKRAMNRVKAGDLEFEMQITSKDEIGQLSLAFEQMRGQLKQSIQTQLQYEENRKELISNISHDLRTPLTAIRGYVEGLEDGVADTPDKRQKYIGIISSKAEEMNRLIDELFLYSKLDLNRLPFNFEVVDLQAFLADWSEDLEFELGKQGVRYEADIALGQRAQASLDRDKMKRVFANIVDNSLKYMNKPEKKMSLRAFGTPHRAVIEIADNGQGIDAEALPHIFERFYRVDPSRNSHTGGSGLGLAISRQIVEGHGGTIEAHSVKGEGVRMTITLPLRLHKDGDDR
ncbi:histidine kinase [Gordoniibacillus kamchatkensis]|uniref:histidine kinase n=1 Tax=Gordoniibacillus kamchatkensis TaxID=1590651 RepID=A0ABR5AHD4_9BACL|nr:HAMP domain-containing sensor histidine kinase [Paenibacillus sp. VKM B-2647]KIL40312.1 histidine kinase [Paenibacillus sp. VKM B-2647]